MKKSTQEIINRLFERMEILSICEEAIKNAVTEMIKCFRNSNQLLICGNGGSASDTEHIVGELMKGFLLERMIGSNEQSKLKNMFPETADYLIRNLQVPLPAISLVSQTSLMTAYANDKVPDLVFAQQVLGYGRQGDILLAITTSGNSKSVIYASQIAKLKGMIIISLTGQSGGLIKKYSDVLINVPTDVVYEVQEYHLPIYHTLCSSIENEFFSKED